MNKFFKRLALLLAVLMIVSMMPVQLFADNSVTSEEQSNGTGEASGNSNAVAKSATQDMNLLKQLSRLLQTIHL